MVTASNHVCAVYMLSRAETSPGLCPADAAMSPRVRVTDSLKLLLGADEEELATVLRQHREAVRITPHGSAQPGQGQR